MKPKKFRKILKEAGRADVDLRMHEMDEDADAVQRLAKAACKMARQIKRMVKSERALIVDILEYVTMADSTVGKVRTDTMAALRECLTDRLEELKK